MRGIRWRHPEPGENGNGSQKTPQAPQEWRYEVILHAATDPGEEVDRALKVWFGNIVKEIHPC